MSNTESVGFNIYLVRFLMPSSIGGQVNKNENLFYSRAAQSLVAFRSPKAPKVQQETFFSDKMYCFSIFIIMKISVVQETVFD